MKYIASGEVKVKKLVKYKILTWVTRTSQVIIINTFHLL